MFKHLGQSKTRRNLVGDANFLALNTDRMFEPDFLTHLVNRTDNKFVGP
jgi:choline kinase